MSDLTSHITTTLRKLGAPDLATSVIVRRVERLEQTIAKREATICERCDEIAALKQELAAEKYESSRLRIRLQNEQRDTTILAAALNRDGVRQAHQEAVERGLGS